VLPGRSGTAEGSQLRCDRRERPSIPGEGWPLRAQQQLESVCGTGGSDIAEVHGDNGASPIVAGRLPIGGQCGIHGGVRVSVEAGGQTQQGRLRRDRKLLVGWDEKIAEARACDDVASPSLFSHSGADRQRRAGWKRGAV
jgi:hypothetical protein